MRNVKTCTLPVHCTVREVSMWGKPTLKLIVSRLRKCTQAAWWVSGQNKKPLPFPSLWLCEAAWKRDQWKARAHTHLILPGRVRWSKATRARGNTLQQHFYKKLNFIDQMWSNYLVVVLLYKEWKVPCLSGNSVKVLYSSSCFAGVNTVKLRRCLLESAVMQTQTKHTVVSQICTQM